jgi:hypothetical protein
LFIDIEFHFSLATGGKSDYGIENFIIREKHPELIVANEFLGITGAKLVDAKEKMRNAAHVIGVGMGNKQSPCLHYIHTHGVGGMGASLAAVKPINMIARIENPGAMVHSHHRLCTRASA